MLVDRRDEGSAGIEAAVRGAAVHEVAGRERWREVVRLLEDNARVRTRLEAVETALLREASACDVAARLGYVSLEEFGERHLGYGRHAANERCRVSLELEALPRLRAAYADGTLAFSHVRELTRVATPQTEGDYLAAAVGKTTRQVQQLVSGKRAGDPPDAPPDPALVTHTLVLELGGEAFAMWRRAQQVLEDEVGERLSTDELVMQRGPPRRELRAGMPRPPCSPPRGSAAHRGHRAARPRHRVAAPGDERRSHFGRRAVGVAARATGSRCRPSGPLT